MDKDGKAATITVTIIFVLESKIISPSGEAGGRHQGEEELNADRPAEVHVDAAHAALQYRGHQVFLAAAASLL